MTSFLPDPGTALGALALLAGIPIGQVLMGYVLSREGVARHAALLRIAAWGALLVGVLAAHRLTPGDPPGFRMVTLIVSALAGVKTIVGVEHSIRGERLPFLRWVAFVALWMGMRVSMVAAQRRPRAHATRHIVSGLVWIGLGVALLLTAHWTWRVTGSAWAATPMILVGFSFVVHFGALSLSSGLWRAAGFDAPLLFRSPLRSTTLGEFWARRWNVGFSEMTAIAVARPVGAGGARLGLRPGMARGTAIILGFLFSGLLHESAISLPVQSGWGLPTAYFLLHGTLVLVERALRASGHPLRGAVGRGWTVFWLVAPLPILFHPDFIREVVWALAGIGG